MFFGKGMKKGKLINVKKQISLHKSNCFKHKKSLDKTVFFTWNRRTAYIISGKKKASLTIEAALVLPIFLFFFLGMAGLLMAIQTEGAVRASLWETGKKLSTYAYITQMDGEDEKKETLFGMGAAAYAHSSFLEKEGKDYWDQSIVSGGSKGFSFLRSSFLKEDGNIDLIVTYQLDIPFLMLGEIHIPQIQRCRIRGWIGDTGNAKEKEGMVYITEWGTVYHLTKNCSYLSLSIQEISPTKLPEARNSSGGKYSPCEKCGKKPLQGKNFYIAKEGDRYHTQRNCSGLKRMILTIPLSQVGSRSLCKRCGG